MSRSKSRKFADILSGNMGNILDDGLIDATEISNLGTAATAAVTDFLPSTMATATNATGSDFVPVYDASAGVWKRQTITVVEMVMNLTYLNLKEIKYVRDTLVE